MIITLENIFLIGAVLLFISVLASKAGSRIGVPVLLLFLIVGMLAGVDGLGINFASPAYAQFIGNMALVVILFSGGMDTKFGDIRPIFGVGIVLASVGVLLTALVTGVFIWLLVQGSEHAATFGLLECILLASVMSSTDSASVFGILRGKNINIRREIQATLEFESGSNDPMAYMLTIFLIQIITSATAVSGWRIAFDFVLQFAIGIVAGYFLGRLLVRAINRINLINQSLYVVLLLSGAFFVYGFTNLIYGNGFLAVYVAGIIIGNRKMVHQKSISNFTDGLAWLFQIIMFLTLGLLVNPHEMLHIIWIGLLVGLFLIFIGRPLVVMLCTAFSKSLSFKGRLFVSWVGLRGAVPIIFATYPLTAGLPQANTIFNIVFFITLLSLLIQGTSIPWMAKLLGLIDHSRPKPSAFQMAFSEEIKSAMSELDLTEQSLEKGNRLMDLDLPDHTLVVMVKRNHCFFIPKGNTALQPGDKLLLISDDEAGIDATYDRLGIDRG